MKNLVVTYMNRDAANYKQSRTVVFAGDLPAEAIAAIEERLGSDFYPSQVGLEPLYTLWPTSSEDDHPGHEIVEVTVDSDPATESRSAVEFYDRVLATEFDIEAAYSEFRELLG